MRGAASCKSCMRLAWTHERVASAEYVRSDLCPVCMCVLQVPPLVHTALPSLASTHTTLLWRGAQANHHVLMENSSVAQQRAQRCLCASCTRYCQSSRYGCEHTAARELGYFQPVYGYCCARVAVASFHMLLSCVCHCRTSVSLTCPRRHFTPRLCGAHCWSLCLVTAHSSSFGSPLHGRTVLWVCWVSSRLCCTPYTLHAPCRHVDCTHSLHSWFTATPDKLVSVVCVSVCFRLLRCAG